MSTKTLLISSVLSCFFLSVAAGQCFADASAETVSAAAPNPSGLVAHYEFDGDAADISGFQPQANGTLIGNPTYGSGVYGKAIDLDGDGDYVDCGNESFFDINDLITITAWIKVNEFDKKHQAIITKGDNSWRLARVGDSNSVEFACNGTATTRWTGEGEVPWAVLGTTSVNDDKWHHIAGVFDGTQLYLYIDGVLEAAKSATNSINISKHKVYIGANAQVPGREWNGSIDDVRIYNYALSQAEIVSIMGISEIYLPESEPAKLYNIAKRYDGLKKFEEAKGICQLILQKYPDSLSAHGAQLYLSRRNIMSLIKSKEYTEAQSEFDNLIADVNDHPDLPKALLTIAVSYGWAKKYEEAENIYERIIKRYPESPSATQSRFKAPSTHIFSLILSGNNTEAQGEIDKFTSDFAKHPALPGVVYWFAKEFEASKAYEEAMGTYQRVAWQYPGSSHAANALLEASKMDVLSLVESGNDMAIQEALDTLIVDFNDHPDLPEAVFVIGEQYYYKAFEDPKKCRRLKSQENLKKAADIWERIVAQWPDSKSIGLKHAQYFTAVCYRRFGEYEKAITNYQKVVDNWPEYDFAWSAQYLIGNCYEKLKDFGSLPESEASLKMEQAYKAVVEGYPDCAMVPTASLKLGHLNLKSGQKIEAAQYFVLFLATARPNDPRITSVESHLEKLKEEVQ
ncbi:MAG: tetratricopeptide repeat protein [Planctomycetes bacterium]|nr:tetratricopeptide repeat protein [Planctomycetota bacterium]